ncbi:MAG TPA: hypothetical protein VFJ74_03620 [Gemmatimonadaceae bacterium]|nr:hypothetical protein [Gemmatimonadaceae bacterium]
MNANTDMGFASSAAVVVLQQAAGQTQQPTEAQLQSQLRQAEQEVRKAALENARTQLEQQRAQLEAQRSTQRVIVAPAPPGTPRITITRDGQPSIVVGGGAGPVMPGTGSPDGLPQFDIPHGAVVLGLAFFVMLAFIAVGLPVARAIARRMDRRSTVSPAPAVPSDVTDRLERIEHAVESIAIEVERISEGQRFTTKLLADRGEVPAAAALATPRNDQFAGGGR